MNGISRGRNFIDQVVQVTVQMKKGPITPHDRCHSRTKSNVVGCENTERIGRNKKKYNDLCCARENTEGTR